MTTQLFDIRHFLLLVGKTLFLILAWGLITHGCLHAQESPAGYSPAEKFVLEHVAAGTLANLAVRFADERDRVITAAFLDKLLTGQLKDVTVHRHGVQIARAVLNEPIELKNADVVHATEFLYCQFNGGIDLEGTHFHRNLSFFRSMFTGDGEKANFRSMEVTGDANFLEAVFVIPADFDGARIGGQFLADEAQFVLASFNGMKAQRAVFRKAVFSGSADFTGAEIGGQFVADDVKFNDAKGAADFGTMKVGGDIFFRNAVFAGSAVFLAARIGGSFIGDDVQFTNAEETANFNTMSVGGTAFFNKAVFAGPVDFGFAEIGSQFVAENAQFRNAKAEAIFNSMSVRRNAIFDRTVFAGPVNFLGSKVQGHATFREAVFDGSLNFMYVEVLGTLQATEAQFRNTEAKVQFDAMKVGGFAYFNKAVFAGTAEFLKAEIGNQFEVNEAQFRNAEADANFSSMRVQGKASFEKTLFAGPVSFADADIVGDFIADEAQFTSAAATIDFNGVKVGGTASLTNAVINGPISILDAELSDLIVEGKEESSAAVLPSLSLSHTLIHRELRLRNIRLGELVAFSLKVTGVAGLNRVNIVRATNLERAHFVSLNLSDVTWPSEPRFVRLEGMTYEQISGGDKKDSWKKLLQWINGSAYNTQPYLQLETSLRAAGYQEQADEVYVALKQRERREVLGLGSPGWWKNVMLYMLVRYGRSPQWALYWSTLVIFFGALVFARRNHVQARKIQDESKVYSPVWYSLDLFIPFVDLGAANVWIPAEDSRFRRNYARVHRILGWILIPIGLVAITGILK